jgi:hypothetical protein
MKSNPIHNMIQNQSVDLTKLNRSLQLSQLMDFVITIDSKRVVSAVGGVGNARCGSIIISLNNIPLKVAKEMEQILSESSNNTINRVKVILRISRRICSL